MKTQCLYCKGQILESGKLLYLYTPSDVDLGGALVPMGNIQISLSFSILIPTGWCPCDKGKYYMPSPVGP